MTGARAPIVLLLLLVFGGVGIVALVESNRSSTAIDKLPGRDVPPSSTSIRADQSGMSPHERSPVPVNLPAEGSTDSNPGSSDPAVAAPVADYEIDRQAYFRDNLTRYLLRLQKEPTTNNCHMLMGFVIGANVEMRGLGDVLKRDESKLDMSRIQAGGDLVLQVNNRLYVFSPNAFPEYGELCDALGVNGQPAQQATTIGGSGQGSDLVSRIVDRATEALDLVK